MAGIVRVHCVAGSVMREMPHGDFLSVTAACCMTEWMLLQDHSLERTIFVQGASTDYRGDC